MPSPMPSLVPSPAWGLPFLGLLLSIAVLPALVTYVGNAPNMMLRAIAAHRGVRMPGFIGFMLLSSALLLPVFVLLSVVFFR